MNIRNIVNKNVQYEVYCHKEYVYVDDDFKTHYSRMKLGLGIEGLHFAKEIIADSDCGKSLFSNIDFLTYAPYIESGAKNSSFILCSYFHYITKIPVIHLHKVSNRKIPYYLLSESERYRVSLKEIQSVEYDLSGKNILIIDDCIASGSVLKACIQKLYQAGAKNVKGHVVVDLGEKGKVKERPLDYYFLHENKDAKILQILKSNNTVLTNRILSALFDLDETKYMEIMSNLPPLFRLEIERYIDLYL